MSKEPLPSWMLGLWCREWVRYPGVMIEDPKATQNSPQLVRYLQSPRFYGDMRYPKDRPAYTNAKSFADMSDSDLLTIAKAEGFVGYTTAENSDATHATVQWHRELDFNPTNGVDISRVVPMSDDRIYESALDNTWTEHYFRLTSGENRFLVVRVECAGRLDQILIVGGDQFYYARNRTKDLPATDPPSDSLIALITSTHATRAQIMEFLDCEFRWVVFVVVACRGKSSTPHSLGVKASILNLSISCRRKVPLEISSSKQRLENLGLFLATL